MEEHTGVYRDTSQYWPVPFGHSELQLSEEVLVELIELGQVVQDLIEKTILDHRFPALMGRFGHRLTEVLQLR